MQVGDFPFLFRLEDGLEIWLDGKAVKHDFRRNTVENATFADDVRCFCLAVQIAPKLLDELLCFRVGFWIVGESEGVFRFGTEEDDGSVICKLEEFAENSGGDVFRVGGDEQGECQAVGQGDAAVFHLDHFKEGANVNAICVVTGGETWIVVICAGDGFRCDVEGVADDTALLEHILRTAEIGEPCREGLP